jgi:hypothetical protein
MSDGSPSTGGPVSSGTGSGIGSGIGKVYGIPPQPPVPENTTYLPAGAVTFGVEYRRLDPEALRETYRDDPAQLAELERESPPGGFFAEGLSLHVFGVADGHEYLRFDLFDNPPHYHYNHPAGGGGTVGGIVNNVVDYDAVAGGPMLPWALERLRTRLPEMLRAAGGDTVAAELDPTSVAAAVDELGRLAAGVVPAGTGGGVPPAGSAPPCGRCRPAWRRCGRPPSPAARRRSSSRTIGLYAVFLRRNRVEAVV